MQPMWSAGPKTGWFGIPRPSKTPHNLNIFEHISSSQFSNVYLHTSLWFGGSRYVYPRGSMSGTFTYITEWFCSGKCWDSYSSTIEHLDMFQCFFSKCSKWFGLIFHTCWDMLGNVSMFQFSGFSRYILTQICFLMFHTLLGFIFQFDVGRFNRSLQWFCCSPSRQATWLPHGGTGCAASPAEICLDSFGESTRWIYV